MLRSSSETKPVNDQILVKCKICGETGFIQLPPDVYLIATGLRNILIPAGTLCNHNFLAFVDQNFKVRGYQHIDSTINLHNVESRSLLDLMSTLDINHAPNCSANSELMKDHSPHFEEIMQILKNFSNAVDNVKAIFVISHEKGLYCASEEDYAIAGDLRNLVMTISEFSLSVSHQLQLNDAPNFLEIQGKETRTIIFTRPFGFLVITHNNPNQGLILVTTRKIINKLEQLLESS